MVKTAADLPSEICDILFSLVVNRRDLLCCSLTCRAWYPSTRPRLFHSINLLGSHQYVRFEHLLQGSPKLADCVRDLSITLDGTFSWMDQEAPRILLKLTQVERLSIKNWSATIMSSQTRRNFRKFFPEIKVLSLQDVSFAAYDFPLLLVSCPKLSAVHLEAVYWQFRDKVMMPLPSPKCQIQTLSLRESTAIVAFWLANSPFEMSLQNFEAFWGDPVQATYVRAFLEKAGSRLQQVTLGFHPQQDRVDEFQSQFGSDVTLADIGLCHNTELTSIRIQDDLSGYHPPDALAHKWVSNVIAQLMSPHLCDIYIKLILSSLPTVGGLDWEQIDQHLVRLAITEPRLKVTFYVSLVDFAASECVVPTRMMVDAIVRRLPRLTAQTRRLGVVCENTQDDQPLSLIPFAGAFMED